MLAIRRIVDEMNAIIGAYGVDTGQLLCNLQQHGDEQWHQELSGRQQLRQRVFLYVIVTLCLHLFQVGRHVRLLPQELQCCIQQCIVNTALIRRTWCSKTL